MWSTIKVSIYRYETDCFEYRWSNIYGIGDFPIWLNGLRSMAEGNGERLKEVQQYDGALVLTLYKKEDNGKPFNKYICKICTTNKRKERR